MAQREVARNLIRDKLLQDLSVATLRADAASDAFQEVISDIHSAVPHPDGIQSIKNVSFQLTQARDRMMKAHNRLHEFLNRGIVPEELKEREDS